ncbi:S8 family serine peptidase [Terriglobus albidus]|uniref:S8 family serine peptidase n=1 Tax=Terriglobus albidus TaxID=1592106 RepID=A0A5B9EJJ6_9BACT|nr:S8 family serine peptidase [Terriglobus albidus]QEE30296.1 S8 family serine peptidase [Terriglobus albidus]
MSSLRIAVLDSGVNPLHSHVGCLAAGVNLAAEGKVEDTLDLLGYGTSVAALIHALAPEATIVPVRIFDKTLSTNLPMLVRALEWCAANSIQIINLSLGTADEDHREPFERAVARIAAAGAVLVAPYAIEEKLLLPGTLPGVVGVVADTACGDAACTVKQMNSKVVFGAQPYPREIPGASPELNLNGVSFSVARVSAYLARVWPSRRAGEPVEQGMFFSPSIQHARTQRPDEPR